MGWPHSHGSKSHLVPRAISLRWGRDTDTSYGPEFLFEFAGGSSVYVSRAILIKCEPT